MLGFMSGKNVYRFGIQAGWFGKVTVGQVKSSIKATPLWVQEALPSLIGAPKNCSGETVLGMEIGGSGPHWFANMFSFKEANGCGFYLLDTLSPHFLLSQMEHMAGTYGLATCPLYIPFWVTQNPLTILCFNKSWGGETEINTCKDAWLRPTGRCSSFVFLLINHEGVNVKLLSFLLFYLPSCQWLPSHPYQIWW